MDENTILILLGIAGVAATFAGFSGVVAVFGRRAHGEWFLEDLFRLTNMLVTSLGSCLFAFVPLIGLLFRLEGSGLWGVCSTLMAVYCVGYIMNTLPQFLHLARTHPGSLTPSASAVVLSSSFLAAILQVLNAASILFHREPGPYVTGLILYLVISGLQFALLVLKPLSAHRIHEHPDAAAKPVAKESKSEGVPAR